MRAVAVSPDGALVAGSSLDDAVYVWNSSSGRQIYRLAGHGRYGGRRDLSFFADSRGLASWGDDFYLRVWDMKTGKARLEHAIRPKGIEFPDDAFGRYGLAMEYANSGDADAALKEFATLLEKHPEYTAGYFIRQSGDPHEAPDCGRSRPR